MKQKILIAIVLLCLVGIVVLCVIFLGKKEKIENNAFKAIPDDVALIVEIENLNTASAFLVLAMICGMLWRIIRLLKMKRIL